MGSEIQITSEMDKVLQIGFELDFEMGANKKLKELGHSYKVALFDSQNFCSKSLYQCLSRMPEMCQIDYIEEMEDLKGKEVVLFLQEEEVSKLGSLDFGLYKLLTLFFIGRSEFQLAPEINSKTIGRLSYPLTTKALRSSMEDSIKGSRSSMETNSEFKMAFHELKLRALVIDDIEINLTLCKDMLNFLGVEAHCFLEAQPAIDFHKEERIHIIFMDCQMPVLDGYEASNIIRQIDERSKELPIIAMTASSLQSEKKKCFESGMTDFIKKPISIEALYSVIQNWVLKETGETREADWNTVSESGLNLAKKQTSSGKSHAEFELEKKFFPVPEFVDLGRLQQLLKSVNREDQSLYLGALYEAFLEQCELASREIPKAREAVEWEELFHCVHRMKGAALNMGFQSIAEKAKSFETFRQNENMEQAKPVLFELESSILEASQWLKSVL
jgi:CheY-like chemotaxis protein